MPIIILVILLASISFFWLYESRIFVIRARRAESVFSVDNSYVFVTPLRAKATGDERIRVTVFVLNSQGLGVLGRQIEPARKPNIPLNIEMIQGRTDTLGKAVFDVTSNKAGEYYLEVKVDSVILPQRIRLSFY